jgi:hypothetical protein
MTELGPVQLITVGFGPDANFEGRIIDELVALEGKNTIRVLDLLFVLKDAESGELVELDHKGEELGAIVGALLGLDFDSDAARQVAGGDDGGHAFGLSQTDIDALGRSLEPGTAAGFLLIEHIWARDLKQALRDAGGVPLGEEFLTAENVAAVSGELIAMAEAAQSEADSTV